MSVVRNSVRVLPFTLQDINIVVDVIEYTDSTMGFCVGVTELTVSVGDCTISKLELEVDFLNVHC